MDINILSKQERLTLLKDARYSRLFNELKSKQQLIDAGFIEEPEIIKDNGGDKVKLIPGNGIILLLTGCFAPCHVGHLGSLALAKEGLERLQDLKVDAGFLGFCHDKYVRKKVGNDDFNLDVRLEKFHAIKDSESDLNWIYEYDWEARQDGPMNFTSVIEQLKSDYPDKTVVFVYGSDNINFKWVINDDEWQVCVERSVNPKNEIYIDGPKKILYIKESDFKEVSSSVERGVEK